MAANPQQQSVSQQAEPSNITQALHYLQQMDHELRFRQPEIELWERYFEGVHRLQFATSRFRMTFGNLFHEFADNWMELIVVASVERLNIQGFRVGGLSEGVDGDDAAWDIWRDNNLPSQSDIAHTEAVKLGKSYALIDPWLKTDKGNPVITVEHPAQATVAYQAGNSTIRKAAFKTWVDHDGHVRGNVYMHDAMYRFRTDRSIDEQSRTTWGDMAGQYTAIYGNLFPLDYIGPPAAFLGEGATWLPYRGDGQPAMIPHTLGVVPMVPLENNPSLKVGGRSDIAPIIPIQDAINKLCADMIIASEFASFGQRWATGIEIPKDPQTGQPITDQRFLASVSRLWVSEDAETKFGQFAASDLKNYVNAIEMLIQHAAATTRTPPHYLLSQGSSYPSGDSLTATETGLVAKVKRKQKNFSPSWEEVLRIALKLKGDSRGDQTIDTIWGDPEQRVRASRIDAAIKLATIGVPQDALWEEAGFSPSDIKRMHAMRLAMGIEEYGTFFAPYEMPPQPAILGPDGNPIKGTNKPGGQGATSKQAQQKPPNMGPDGNLVAIQNATQSARVARIHD